MEGGEIKKSPAKYKVINVNYKMFLFSLLSLAMFSPVATDIESGIAKRIAWLELFFEDNASHTKFK